MVGVGGSVAANVAHAQAHVGAQVAAAFPPLALLLCVEIMTRLETPPSWRWRLARWAGTGSVAAVAAMASYVHQAALFSSYGEPTLIAGALPIAVDGLMLVASVTLLANSRQREVQDQQQTSEPAPTPVPALVPLLKLSASDKPEAEADENLTSSRALPTADEPYPDKVNGSRAEVRAKREEAQRQAREWISLGQDVDPEELGKLFGMSRSWGRDQLRAARNGSH